MFTKDLLDQTDIPFKNRELPCLETVANEIRHELLLKFYRLYLEDKGVIYKYAETNLQHTEFHFLLSDGPTYFNTSDSPSFVFQRTDGLWQGVMPITPYIILVQGRCSNNFDVYYISHITDKEVHWYNATIRENASEFIIHARYNRGMLKNLSMLEIAENLRIAFLMIVKKIIEL